MLLKEEKSSECLLFRVIPKASNLAPDQIQTSKRILFSIAFVLILIDIVAVVFFIKTNDRLNTIEQHNFTQTLINGIQDSVRIQEVYALKARELMFSRMSFLKHSKSSKKVEFSNSKSVSSSEVKLPSLDSLNLSINKLKNSGTKESRLALTNAISHYKLVEHELKMLNTNLSPLEDLSKNISSIETKYRLAKKEIEDSLEILSSSVLERVENRLELQRILQKQSFTSLDHFDFFFERFHDGEKFRKMIDLYNVKFSIQENSPLKFQVDEKSNKKISKLTPETSFNLRLPRFYYCTLKATLYSDKEFSVRFRYLDLLNTINPLFESHKITSGPEVKTNYDVIHTFRLEDGPHSLQLELEYIEGKNAVMIMGTEMNCLSYRLFAE